MTLQNIEGEPAETTVLNSTNAIQILFIYIVL